MDRLEQIEKLRERANVSYDEAKEAYDAADGDLLDALIYLEKQGKVETPSGGGYYNGKKDETKSHEYDSTHKERENPRNTRFRENVEKLGKYCVKIINKGNNTFFEVLRDEESKIKFPVTVLVLFLIFAPYIIIPLIIIGFFFGYHYRFLEN